MSESTSYSVLFRWFTVHERFLCSCVLLPYKHNESILTKVHRIVIAGSIFMLVMETCIALYEAKTLLDFVVPACWASIMCQISYLLYRIMFRPEIFRELLGWCQSRAVLRLHPTVQSLVRLHMDQGLNEALFMSKSIILGFYADYAMVIWIPAIFGSFLPNTVWPEYNLPFPGHLPLYPAVSTVSCGINFAFQGFAILVLIIICGVGFSMAFTVLCFIKAQISLLNSVTRYFFKMADIYDGSKRLKFETFLNIVVSLHNDLLSKFETLNNVVRIVCFLLEFNSCSGIFLVALVVMVEGGKKTILMGLSTTIAIALLGGFSYFSDTMKEQLHEISWEIYNCPWYKLPADQQRQLVLVIKQSQKPICVKSVFNFMTLEKFGSIIKATYSYCLALNNLLNRQSIN